MPNRGLVLGNRLSAREHPLPSDAAVGKGDPQWHAGDDPLYEEACVYRGGCTNVSNMATAQ